DRHQRTHAATVCRDYAVRGERAVPLADAVSEFAVALAAGRRKIPFVAFARTQHAGVSRLDFLKRQTFPFAISDFDQFRVNFVVVRLKTKCGAQDLHRFTVRLSGLAMYLKSCGRL